MRRLYRHLRFFVDNIETIQRSIEKIADFVDGRYVLLADHSIRVRGLIEANTALVEENRRLRVFAELEAVVSYLKSGERKYV